MKSKCMKHRQRRTSAHMELTKVRTLKDDAVVMNMRVLREA
ncbi:hypothetical protein [Candidatus Sarmatiella mevalonica]|nr:hypothetical protein [Candidatus Sarmatiella mevalonica]